MKIPKTLGLSEELWDEIEERRGAMNRSAFVETCLVELFKAQDALREQQVLAEDRRRDWECCRDRGQKTQKT